LAIPECSCKQCLELMLREFSPDVVGGEITIVRNQPRGRPEPGERHEAA
jgi:hypothetical protein